MICPNCGAEMAPLAEIVDPSTPYPRTVVALEWYCPQCRASLRVPFL